MPLHTEHCCNYIADQMGVAPERIGARRDNEDYTFCLDSPNNSVTLSGEKMRCKYSSRDIEPAMKAVAATLRRAMGDLI